MNSTRRYKNIQKIQALLQPKTTIIYAILKDDVFVAKICKYALYENSEGLFCARRKPANFCHPGVVQYSAVAVALQGSAVTFHAVQCYCSGSAVGKKFEAARPPPHSLSNHLRTKPMSLILHLHPCHHCFSHLLKEQQTKEK